MPLPVIRYIISERYGYSMYEEELFAKRLEQLRLEKNVSAREMSLSLGQNPSYINRIESGKALPSLSLFTFVIIFRFHPKIFLTKAKITFTAPGN